MEWFRLSIRKGFQAESSSGLNFAARERAAHPPRFSSIGATAWFALTLTGIYALVLSFALFHHEMWRDEINPWLLARDSAGVFELFRNLEYEGHPGLWYLLLMPVTRLTNSPVGMQILHLLIASTTVFVVARYAPYSTLQKALFSFGYFPLYEYGVKSRGYALGLLFVVVTCVLLRQRWRHPLWLALVLCLMSHTSVHACIIAVSITFGLALDYWLNRRTLATDDTVDAWRVYAAFVIVFGAILLAILQLSPPADAYQMLGYREDHIRRILTFLQTVFFSPHFFFVIQTWLEAWVSSWTGLEASEAQQVMRNLQDLFGVYVCVFLATIVVYCRRQPIAQVVFLCGGAGLLHFFTLIHGGRVRHYGFFMIALILLLWGGRYLTAWSRGVEKGPPMREAGASFGGMLLTGLLVLHALSGLNAVAADIEHPFSLGKRAAEYIQAENLDSLPMIGHQDFSVTTVVGYLQRQRKVHYVRGNREGSFVFYDEKPQRYVDDSVFLLQTRTLADRTGGKVLMILNLPLSIDVAAQYEIRPLAAFTGAMCRQENFYLYLYEKEFPTRRSETHSDTLRHTLWGPRAMDSSLGPSKGFSPHKLCED